MSGFKSGFVVIVGRPNVGKSTLMNHLIGQKVAITSKKPQTTRNRIETVLTTEEGQIIFLDTPGMLRKAKNRLGAYMMEVSSGTLEEADVVLFLVEPSSYIGEGDREIAEKLKGTRTPVILVINKIDTIEKTKILEIIAAYRKLMDFAEIVPVSALRDQNLDDLKTTVLKYLPEGPMYFDADTLTDQPMRQIAAEVIRAVQPDFCGVNEKAKNKVSLRERLKKLKEERLAKPERERKKEKKKDREESL